MKYIDYKCSNCGNVVVDYKVLDGEVIPADVECPVCGNIAIRLLSFNKVIPQRHRAV
jgi:rubredoxin